MARPFIGEGGFYPDWAKGNGRWVLQRVFASVDGFMLAAMDRGEMANEGLVWVPANQALLGRLFAKTNPIDEAQRALEEIALIPMECADADGCGWRGFDPDVQTSVIRLGPKSSSGPAHWAIRCPDCFGVAGPILTGLNPDVILQRWQILGRPVLDPPHASPLMQSAKEVTDLPSWIKRLEPMGNELAYVGQQLWSSFGTFIGEVQRQQPSRLRRGSRTVDEMMEDEEAAWDLSP